MKEQTAQSIARELRIDYIGSADLVNELHYFNSGDDTFTIKSGELNMNTVRMKLLAIEAKVFDHEIMSHAICHAG